MSEIFFNTLKNEVIFAESDLCNAFSFSKKPRKVCQMKMVVESVLKLTTLSLLKLMKNLFECF